MSSASVPSESFLFIDGERRSAAGKRRYPIHNPARPDELVGHAAKASVEDVNAAFAAAQKAFDTWSRLSCAQRGEYLAKIAAHLIADAADLQARVNLFTREHGKILKESHIEMSRLGGRFMNVASYAARLEAEEHLKGPPFDVLITRRARGVALLVVPWNWPLSILGAKLPQALMAGNTVVIKLPENAAMGPAMTVAKIAEMLPPGVVNLITGSSVEIGDVMLTHPTVSMINFTGSIAVGSHVMAMAAQRIVPVTLELGGNDAGLVLEDAVLDEAALTRMYLGAFMTSGQICMALKRLYVQKSRFDEVVHGLSTIANRQVIGDGLDERTTMGPVNNGKQLKVVTDMIAQALAAGAEVMEFGQVHDPALFRAGYFQRPALVLNPDSALDVVREEQFGPVLPIIAVEDEADGIRQANDSRFALCSSVWTSDMDRAVRVARRLEAGYTYVNQHGPLGQDDRAPFGGFKQSGIGRNLGYEGVLSFQGYQSIVGPQGALL